MLSDLKFTFNGITSDEMGLYNVKINQGDVTHPLGGAKTITTSRGMYARRNIITSVQTEPITFSLIFTAMDKPFTPLRIREIYTYFDVDDYKKLSFNTNPDFYYNVMPMTSQTELTLFCNNVGTFAIDFVCDAHHGWIDREYNLSYGDSGVWKIYNESNVRNAYGNYLVYPTFTVNITSGSHFGLCPRYVANGDTIPDGETLDYSETSAGTEVYKWFRMNGLTTSETDPLNFTVDNQNQQVYNNSTSENLLTTLNGKYNFIGLQEGHTYLYREHLQGETLTYTMKMNVSYPVIM